MTQPSFGLSEQSIQIILSILSKYPKVKKAIIYGSRAKGNYKAGSDIDMTLIGPELTTSDLLQIDIDLDDSIIPYQVDLSIFHQIQDPDFIDHIQRVGKVFYQRD